MSDGECNFMGIVEECEREVVDLEPTTSSINQILEDRSNKLKQLSEALEVTLATQMMSQFTPNKKSTELDSNTHGAQAQSNGVQPPLPENALGLDLGRMSPDYHKMMRGLDSIAPSFTPHITPMARNICSEEPFHVRLYRQAMEKAERTPTQDSPRGRISSLDSPRGSEGPSSARGVPAERAVPGPSGSHVRSRSAEPRSKRVRDQDKENDAALEALYQEAFERKDRMQLRRTLAEDRAQNQRNIPKISKNSEDFVRRRRDKELHDIWSAFVASQGTGQEKVAPEFQRINYVQLHDILRQMGFFTSFNSGHHSADAEEKLTDKMWCAMNADGMPFVQYPDFIRVIGALLERRTAKKPPRSKSQTISQRVSRTEAPSIAWKETPIQWENQAAANTVNAVAAALNLDTAAPYAYEAVLQPSPREKGGDPEHPEDGDLTAGGVAAAINAAAHRPPTASKSGTPQKPMNEADALLRKSQWRQELTFNNLYRASIGHTSKDVKDLETQECTFQPTINSHSRRIEDKMEDEVAEMMDGKKKPRYQSMYERNRRAKKKLEEIREERDSKEVEHCTFKPAINKWRPLVSKDKAPRLQVPKGAGGARQEAKPKIDPNFETTEEKEFKEFCTFKPTFPSQKTYEMVKRHNQRPDTTIAGYDDHVKRLSYAQQEKQERQMWQENLKKGRPAHCDPQKYEEKNTEKQTTPKPFNFHLDKRQRSKPLLYMDINIGHGRSGRLGIHENDDPCILARNFAASYQLDEALRKKLENLLTQHMEQMIPGFRERQQQLKDEMAQGQDAAEGLPATPTAMMPSGVAMDPHGRDSGGSVDAPIHPPPGVAPLHAEDGQASGHMHQEAASGNAAQGQYTVPAAAALDPLMAPMNGAGDPPSDYVHSGFVADQMPIHGTEERISF
eukprot:CAMPEP_0174316736 /NCGR_PEP_ID=MMETSP0810-20121108/7152_1 /TAXON_ID=73025 ORGANISM="Eutreptiella gymnastica-like, Strain CCMP1594" /NCGR_SAMPLE_ID=MMETSP0810 /ASSEMBLY_ACC=CAM_ASM_000659 /LENGTH=902 /DNA_ID=CAMNT_0015426555 /DNA_START=100 /DNA_END=2809 /DNA_ORIENTATION=+